jgi:HK97 family phage major capsid protein
MYFLSPASVSSLEGLKNLQGDYIYRPPAAGMPAMLWGYPICDNYGINAMTLTSAAGLKFAAFGNPKLMLMGLKRNPEILISREGILDTGSAVTFNALQADGAIIRVTERVGFKQVLTTGISVLKTAAA